MALADGGLARLFGAALGGLYAPATLHRVTRTRARGGSTSESVADLPCRAQVEAVEEAMQPGGATAREVRIRVLAASLDGGITTDDRISVGGVRYAISAVGRDPARACHELRGQRG